MVKPGSKEEAAEYLGAVREQCAASCASVADRGRLAAQLQQCRVPGLGRRKDLAYEALPDTNARSRPHRQP